jgi:dimethylargininase
VIALTHVPSPQMQACERTFVPHQAIDSQKIAEEHAAYCKLLADCGANVRQLDVNCGWPDCAFLEDTAVVLDEVAILCSMGAASRRAEPRGIEPVLREFREVERVDLPAMIEGGDVLRIGQTLLVGQSGRTNAAGIAALAVIAGRHGYTTTGIPVRRALHLKTACTALPDGRLLVNPNWIDTAALRDYEQVRVPEAEPWGANVALVGTTVLMNAVHVQTAGLVRSLGFDVRTTDLSEFAKAEGGVTCLSLLLS